MKKKLFFLAFVVAIAILGMAFWACPSGGEESVNKGADGPEQNWDDSWTPPADTTQAYPEVSPDVTAGTKVYFLAPTGDDTSGDGSKENPWFSLTKAQTAANPGDTIYLRAGRYQIDNNYGIDQENNMNGTARTRIPLTKSGTEGHPITYAGYPGDYPNRAIIDFSTWRPGGDTGTARSCGIALGLNTVGDKADWLWLRDFDLTGLTDYTNSTSSNGYVFQVNNANHTTIENLRIYDCAGTGIYMFQNQICSYVLVKNCDFFQLNNARTSNVGMNQNTDGGGFHIGNTNSVNNVFYGCRSWAVGDDGFDSIRAITRVVYDHCWIAYVGFNYKFTPSPPPARPATGTATYNQPTVEEYNKWTTWLKDNTLDALGQGETFSYNGGNGNGLKLGGYAMNAASGIGGAIGNVFPAENPGHVMRYCLAVYNQRAGVTHNYAGGKDDPGSPGQHYYNVTTYNNRINFEMIARDPETLTGSVEGRRRNAYNVTMKNNISYKNLPKGHFLYDEIDYWLGQLPVKEYPVRWLDAESGVLENNTFGVADNGGKLNHALDGPFNVNGGDKTDFDDNGGKYLNGYQAVKDVVNLVEVTDAMFQSLDDNLFLTPRKRNGDLPETKYLRPKGGTPIADKGYTSPDTNADGFGDLWKYAGANPLLKNW